MCIRDRSQSLNNKKTVLEKAKKTVKELLSILGLKLDKEVVIGVTTGRGVKVTLSWEELVKRIKEKLAKKESVNGLMEQVIAVRAEARAKKDYSTSDEIRAALKRIGVELEDTENGVKWRVK